MAKHVADVQVDLSHVQLLVLDEADKVLEAGKGFIEQVDAIYAACAKSPRLSTGLFSATLPPWVTEVAGSVMHAPTSIVVGAKNVSSLNVEQSLQFVGQVRSSARSPPRARRIACADAGTTACCLCLSTHGHCRQAVTALQLQRQVQLLSPAHMKAIVSVLKPGTANHTRRTIVAFGDNVAAPCDRGNSEWKEQTRSF